jgi:predicted nuclease with RNAse H fold
VLDDDRVEVVDYGTGKDVPFYDDQLLAYLRSFVGTAPEVLVAVDAPLSLPGALQTPPLAGVAEWFNERAHAEPGKKPRFTPYTQRATEVILQEEHAILPRETLGQGMGPLTARAVWLKNTLAPQFTVGNNLFEVYPKATIAQLFGDSFAKRYKRSAASPGARLEILNALPHVRFGPGAWREHALDNDHKFDAILCAYTGWLLARGECIAPTDDRVAEDGWIWIPRKRQ